MRQENSFRSLALSYRSYNLPVTILRPFNTYGPRQSARAIIPTILSQILNNNSTIKLGNINPIRDFTYVEDTCNAFLSTLKNKKIIGETINIGNNFEISIREILNILKEDYNFKFRIKIDKKRIRPKKSFLDFMLLIIRLKNYLDGRQNLKVIMVLIKA